MSDSEPRLVTTLPSQPLTHETAAELGESSAAVAIMPIENHHNDLITEFLLILDAAVYAIAFDPDTTTWHVLERRCHDGSPSRKTEGELMELLYEWREEHVLPYLVENDLIPHFELD